jgi:23S rRNA pseudouridine1911/1915/1917 synthase
MPQLSVEPNPSITFKARYGDREVLVIDKPPHVPTQPGKGHERDTLLNGLFAQHGAALQNLGRSRDFGLLHRLDKDTSGLLVVALTPRAYDALRESFQGREVKKFYWAVCVKAPKHASGVVRLPLAETEAGRNSPKLARISRGPEAKEAVTAYRVLQATPRGALVEARPLTGRLHQVRVHMDAIGATILGDAFYGPPALAKASPRLSLHAHRLVFKHPGTGETLDVHSGWPADLRRLLKRLGLDRPDLAPRGAAKVAVNEDAGEAADSGGDE